jgi:hypothetical protein
MAMGMDTTRSAQPTIAAPNTWRLTVIAFCGFGTMMC